MNSHLCSECGELHIVPVLRREHLTKIKCQMLKTAALYVIKTGVNDFSLKELNEESNLYTNFQKLRYHGLVHYGRTATGARHTGHWLITRNGWQFLRGELKLPKYVTVKDNHPLQGGRSDVLVGFLDVLKGADYIETHFDYFDEQTGAMIARRPFLAPDAPAQASLLSVPAEEPKRRVVF